MNLRTLMQTGPAKANDLFARLSETSDGAIRTREKLFADLKAELELHASLEEQHLFPVLRRNPETKELVTDAIKDNRELRAKLAELEALPKNDEAFPERIKELQKAFRQHARDEKRELLPAVQQALTEEQAQDVAGKIEAGLADAEQARQDELRERRLKARQEREQAEQPTEPQAAAVPAPQQGEPQAAAEPAPRQVERHIHAQTEAAAGTARAAQRSVLRVVESAATEAQRISTSMRDATAGYIDVVRAMVPEPQDLSSLPKAAAGAAIDLRSAWLDWMSRTANAGTQVSRDLLRHTAEQQQRFVVDSMQRWMDHNVRVMEITMRVAQEGLRPFLGRSATDPDRRPPGR